MTWQANPRALPLLVCAAIATVAFAVVWQRRDRPGAKAVCMLLLSAIVWSLAYALGLSSLDLESKRFWSKVEYIGVASAPTAWFCLALSFTSRGHWLTPALIAALALEPVLVLALAWSNDLHGLLWRDMVLDTSHPYTLLRLEYGPAFWAGLAYTYALLMSGTWIMAADLLRSGTLYRRQAGLLLVCAAAPWLGNLLRVTGVVTSIDLTPIGFCVVGIGAMWGVARFRLFDLSPIARNAVVESMSDAVIVAGDDDRIIDLNPAARELLGRPDRIIGQPLQQLFPTHPALARNDPGVVGRAEIHLRATDRWCDVRSSTLRSGTGQPLGRLILVRDITAEKRAAHAIRQLNAALAQRAEELEASHRQIETFSYSVSHEIRAPLRSIEGFSRMLMEDHGATLEGEARDYLHRIRSATLRMGQLIDALIELSRLSKWTLDRQPVDLSATAHAIIDELKHSDPDRAVGVTIAEGLVGQGDRRLLTLAMRHLLANAWKYTRHVEAAQIEFGSVQHGEDLVFFVRDNGAGFDMAYADKLFKPFQPLHPVAAFEGTGIGLATVHQVVRLHSGRVWARAAVDEGATFYFTLDANASGANPASRAA